MGTWLQNLALGWLIYRITGSPLLLGVVGFAGQIPALILTPLAGVYADRVNRRFVLILTQVFPMFFAFILSALVFSNTIQEWHIIVLAILNGVFMAIDNPFRHAFVLDMIGDRELLQNAIALNSTLYNSARFIGPMIGGILIALVGEAWCFLINGLSFLAVIISLLSMSVKQEISTETKGTVIDDLKEGLKYAFNFKPIRFLLIAVFMTSFFGLPFQVFLPVFAKDVLSGDSQLLGFITGVLGAGALSGSIYLASRRSMCGVPRLILLAIVIFGISLIGFSLSVNKWLSVFLIYFVGFGMIVQFASTNTLLQTISDVDKRGRMVSLYGLSFMGITPLGSLLLGTITPWAGVQYTMAVAGLFCLLAALIYSRRIPEIKQEVCK